MNWTYIVVTAFGCAAAMAAIFASSSLVSNRGIPQGRADRILLLVDAVVIIAFIIVLIGVTR